MSENTNANKSSRMLRFFKQVVMHVIIMHSSSLLEYAVRYFVSISRDLASRIVGYDYSIWLNGALTFFRWIYEQITIQRLIIIVLQIIAAVAIIIASIVSVIVALWIIGALCLFIINIPKFITKIPKMLFYISMAILRKINIKSVRVNEICTLWLCLLYSPKKIRKKVQFRKIIYGK